MAAPKISVLIPCYCMHSTLPGLLRSLRPMLQCIDTIHIFCDGCPHAFEPEAMDRQKVQVHHRAKNMGLAMTRNELLQKAQSEWVWFLDADTEVHAGCLELLQQLPSACSVLAGQEANGPRGSLCDTMRLRFFAQTHGPRPLSKAPFFMGLCVLGHRETLIQHGFDPSLQTHGEDLDLSFRLQDCGETISYDPRLSVSHQRTDTLQTFSRMLFWHGYWQTIVFQRHGRDLRNLFVQQLRWFWICPLSILRRGGNPLLIGLSLYANSIGLTARVLGAISAAGKRPLGSRE